MRHEIAEPAPDLATAEARLQQHGVAVLPAVLSAVECASVREAVWHGVEANRQGGVQVTGFRRIDLDDYNIRLVNLTGKHAIFRAPAEHPVA